MCIRLSPDFSKETLQARRCWKEVFEVIKGKDLHPRLLYPAKLSFKMEAYLENQDGSVGRHTAPPPTTRTDRKSKGKEVRHQGDKKETYIQTGRRGGDGHQGREDSRDSEGTKTGGVWDKWGRPSDH